MGSSFCSGLFHSPRRTSRKILRFVLQECSSSFLPSAVFMGFPSYMYLHASTPSTSLWDIFILLELFSWVPFRTDCFSMDPVLLYCNLMLLIPLLCIPTLQLFLKIVSSSLLLKKVNPELFLSPLKLQFFNILTFCRNICVYFKMFFSKSKIWEGKSLVFLLMCGSYGSQVPVSLSVTLCFDCVKVYILHHIFYQFCVFTQRTIFPDNFYLSLHGSTDLCTWSASPTWLTSSLATDELHSAKQCCIQRLGRSPWCSKSIKVPSCQWADKRGETILTQGTQHLTFIFNLQLMPYSVFSLIYYCFPVSKTHDSSILKLLFFFSSLKLKTPIVYSAPGHPDTDLFITTYYLVFLIFWILGIALMPVTSWFDLCNELLSLQIRCKRDRKFQKRNIPHLHGIVFLQKKKNLLQHFVLLITQ